MNLIRSGYTEMDVARGQGERNRAFSGTLTSAAHSG